MPFATLGSPVLLAALLVPGWGLAAVVLGIGGVPGEWARMALTVWTALAVALLAGTALAGEAAPLALLALVLGFAAVMTGGPWGLAVAAVAAAALLALPLAGPRWPAILLALPPAAVALRQLVWR
jgi:hypothetical protein